jgi:hypothetical protein
MLQANDRIRWNHTSEIIAALYNTVRDDKKKRKPFTAAEFNPYTISKSQPVRKITIDQWRQMSGGKYRVGNHNGSNSRGNSSRSSIRRDFRGH